MKSYFSLQSSREIQIHKLNLSQRYEGYSQIGNSHTKMLFFLPQGASGMRGGAQQGMMMAGEEE